MEPEAVRFSDVALLALALLERGGDLADVEGHLARRLRRDAVSVRTLLDQCERLGLVSRSGHTLTLTSDGENLAREMRGSQILSAERNKERFRDWRRYVPRRWTKTS